MKLETMKAILGDMAVAALMRLVCCRLQLARLRQPSCALRDHKAREELLEFQQSGCDRLRPGTVVPCRGDVSLVSFKVDLHKVTHNRCATLRLYRLDCAPRRPPSAQGTALETRSWQRQGCDRRLLESQGSPIGTLASTSSEVLLSAATSMLSKKRSSQSGYRPPCRPLLAPIKPVVFLVDEHVHATSNR